jgi:pimeloyl-ACP methyl ester carboxylesterase
MESGVYRPTTMAHLPAGPIEYRLERRGDAVVVVFHGGHVRAGLALGEDVFAAADCTLLAPSRPGYGRTPLSTGISVEGFTDVVRALCADLGITRITAVIGISGGGPTAATMAARHADLVERLILISAVGWLPYPDRRARLGAHVVFAARTEAVTWAGIHAFARIAPAVFLPVMMSSLSTRPVGEAMAALRAEDRELLLSLFAQMRSGRGFLNDLRPPPDVTTRIDQPTLVIATRTDGGVPFAHARSLASAIRNAQLVESRAPTHFVWLGPDWPMIAERIRGFLDRACPPRPTPTDPAPTDPAPLGPAPLGPAPAAQRNHSSRLAAAFHQPLRAATAALTLTGSALAAGTAGPAFARLGHGQGLAFGAVAVVAFILAVQVWRGARWALGLAALGLAGQLSAVAGTLWELSTGIASSKASDLGQLGVSPTVGLLVNLAYSTTAVMLFLWLARRWLTFTPPHTEAINDRERN